MDTAVNTKNATAKKVTKIVLNVLLWIFLLFALVMMIFAFASISNDYGVPILGKKVVLSVVSDSMEPTIEKGDMITGKTLTLEEKQELKVGDIITFFADLDGDGVKDINTHRIVSVLGVGDDMVFRTKGDNAAKYPTNVVDDGYSVRLDDVICTWKEGDTQWHGFGSFLGFLQGRTGFLCIVVIPLILFFIYEIVRFVIMIVKFKGKDKKAISDEEKEEIRRQAIEEYRRSLEAEAPAEEVKAPAEDAAPAEEVAPTDDTDAGNQA